MRDLRVIIQKYESKMDISLNETMKDEPQDEHDSLIHPFSEDERSDSRSGTGSIKHKQLHSSSSDGESNTGTELSKGQEASGTHRHLESDSDVELTNAEMKIKKKIRRALNKHRRHPPKIRESSFMAFLEKLKTKPKLSKQRMNQIDCIQSLHGSKTPMWTGPSAVMKAIKDCILNRKWNNLTHLLLIMIHFPTDKYKPLIKQLCLLIDKHHPVVQENDLTGQFKIVFQATKRSTITKVEDQK